MFVHFHFSTTHEVAYDSLHDLNFRNQCLATRCNVWTLYIKRPISLLPTISKIFERVIHTQLYSYLSENELLYEQQYGFRSQHSTELAAIKFVDYLIHNMDTNKIPTSIYLDLSKAFDTLLFDILLTKFEHYGITRVPLKLLTSYIKDRYQYVIYNGKHQIC